MMIVIAVLTKGLDKRKEKSSNVEKGRLVIMEFFSSYKYHTCFQNQATWKTDAQSSYGESVNKKDLKSAV